MVKKFPILPAHPQRICGGCDKYCPADAEGPVGNSDRPTRLNARGRAPSFMIRAFLQRRSPEPSNHAHRQFRHLADGP